MNADDRLVTDDEYDRRLQQFKLKYLVTPPYSSFIKYATTGWTFSELYLARKATTVLDRLRPELHCDVERRMQT